MSILVATLGPGLQQLSQRGTCSDRNVVRDRPMMRCHRGNQWVTQQGPAEHGIRPYSGAMVSRCTLIYFSWKTMWQYVSKFKMHISWYPTVPLTEVCPIGILAHICKDKCKKAFVLILFVIAKIRNNHEISEEGASEIYSEIPMWWKTMQLLKRAGI